MKILFTTFEGGGHVPPAILTARLLQTRGHEILFVSDEANRHAAEAAGLRFQSWRTAPNRKVAGRADDPLKDWRRIWPPAVVRAVCAAVIAGPAQAYAEDTIALLKAFAPDLVVSNELLFGVLAACEAQGQIVALLTANVWSFPDRPDLPPFGPGWSPARSGFERHREAKGREWIGRWYEAGLPALNRARHALGLPPLERLLDQLATARLVVLGASAAFDFPHHRSDRYVYAGPLLEIEPVTQPHPLVVGGRRNILISFSTTYQGQAREMSRCMRALADLDANVIVTTGPAIDPRDLPASPNARVAPFVPHDAIVPYCDLVVCHGGHGTLLRPLINGVPVLCMPMGRDHPENVRRVVDRGAGLAINRRAPIRQIRAKAKEILTDPGYRGAARDLGRRIMADSPSERLQALAALENLG